MNIRQQTDGIRPELSHFSVRLRSIVGLMPVARFARESGVTESLFRGYLEGRTEPGLLNLQRIARYKGMTLDELCAPDAPLLVDGRYGLTSPSRGHYLDEVAANADLIAIPMLEGAVSAGPGSMIEADSAFEVLHYRRDWVKREIGANLDAIRLARIKGRSMEPRLYDRDRVFIDTSIRVPKRGRVFVFRQDDDFRIKRIRAVFEDGVSVASDNEEAYPAEMLSARDIESGEIQFLGLAEFGERGFRL